MRTLSNFKLELGLAGVLLASPVLFGSSLISVPLAAQQTTPTSTPPASASASSTAQTTAPASGSVQPTDTPPPPRRHPGTPDQASSTPAPAPTPPQPTSSQPTSPQPGTATSTIIVPPASGNANPSAPSSASTTPAASGTPAASEPAVPLVPIGSKADVASKSQSPKPGDAKPGDAKSDPKAANATDAAKEDPLPSPGEALDPHIKPGSEDDVNAVGTRNIGGRGMGNWYSTNWEISNGKQYAMQIEKSAHMVTDPVVNEYVNRIGQNIVKNSDCKVPFTIKVIDTDEINAFALPGGFFYVNSGLIMAADEEAELAGVMAHETAHVCAHHAAREATRMNYAQIGSIPLMIMTEGSWTGYGIYELSQLAVPLTFLQFSRQFESEADWLGLQYMYRAGYDPQAYIQFFEKIDSLEKHKPGSIAKVFADHPQTPDRIYRSEDEIATIMPPKPDYVVTTSEFDDVKARLARLENKRKINNGKDGNKPTLRRVGGTNNDPNNPSSTASDGPPTLSRRN